MQKAVGLEGTEEKEKRGSEVASRLSDFNLGFFWVTK